MEASAEPLTLALEELDLATALRVREVLVRSPVGSVVELDLTAARRCEDAAVMVVADAAIRCPTVHVALRGLAPRQLRLLQHLGFRVAGGEVGARAAEASIGFDVGRPT
ncbi:MAG TPA: hypothetical protein VH880_08270 [Anaeromyxobacteraceae bacterium]|jgi:hypothetical protein